jgi:hypothetical protein
MFFSGQRNITRDTEVWSHRRVVLATGFNFYLDVVYPRAWLAEMYLLPSMLSCILPVPINGAPLIFAKN